MFLFFLGLSFFCLCFEAIVSHGGFAYGYFLVDQGSFQTLGETAPIYDSLTRDGRGGVDGRWVFDLGEGYLGENGNFIIHQFPAKLFDLVSVFELETGEGDELRVVLAVDMRFQLLYFLFEGENVEV